MIIIESPLWLRIMIGVGVERVRIRFPQAIRRSPIVGAKARHKETTPCSHD
jgi:hypothetical protein